MLNEGIQVVDSPLWQLEGLVTAVSGILPVVLRLQTAHRQIANIQGDRDEDAYLMGEMERVFIERSTYLVPNSRAMFEAMEKLYGLTPREGRYLIVPHGVVPVPEEDIRPFDLQRKTDTFTVLYVGRLEKRKGIMTLFQAIPLVMQKLQNVKFIIAGGDNSIHDGFRHQTGMDYPSYFVKHYPSFVSCVHFLGAVDEEVLRGLYQTCDLFVAPSLYESFGLVFLEAMNYAKPVVGCHAGGVPEVVAHGVSGLLVEPEDPAALADAIVSLLKSPTKLYEMGMAGRQLLLEKFTHIQMARHFERVYRAAIQIWNTRSPDISSEE
jgi:glycosyltransferase involved in cell wall biosynthesis